VSGFDITSPSNERIKRLVRLRDRRHRDEEGNFLVEGPRLVERAIAAGFAPAEVFVDGSVDYHGPGQVFTTHPDALARASYRERSQGIIAVFPQFPTGLDEIVVSDPALVVVTEGIEKPGNLGAMLRTADAVGADALIVTGDTVDPFNPNVVRASQGALFSVPLAVAGLGDLMAWTEGQGIDLVAATPDSVDSLWDADLGGSVAILIGSEDLGLSSHARAAASRSVSVPMAGAADSLNASVSLAVIAYEVLRQRR
jgi:TrmH family RNA methyltransferase